MFFVLICSFTAVRAEHCISENVCSEYRDLGSIKAYVFVIEGAYWTSLRLVLDGDKYYIRYGAYNKHYVVNVNNHRTFKGENVSSFSHVVYLPEGFVAFMNL